MGSRRGTHPRAVVVGAVVSLQVAMCAALLLIPLDREAHRAPVSVAGPAIVADSLADRANALDGRPLRAESTSSTTKAREDVVQGRAVAAVVVDVRLGTATVLVSSAQGEALTASVVRVVRSMAEPFAAQVTIRDVAPLPSGSAGQAGLRLVVACAVLVGLILAITLTWRRGAVADTWREALRRVAIAGGISAAASWGVAVVAADHVGGEITGWWLVAGLTMLATGSATLALEGLFGSAGIGLATLVLVASAAPLARVEHPLLLAEPWRTVTSWVPHGAALDAGRQMAFFGGAGSLRPLTVLAGWVAVSYVLLVVARQERRRAGVDLNATT
jgi:hypothetical protein